MILDPFTTAQAGPTAVHSRTIHVEFLIACLCFSVGLYLSAFFSGSETGFYRASVLRLNLDARGGDRVAQRLLWFIRHPSAFVATTLVGNNIANYLTTFAIGLAAAAVSVKHSGWVEITATICISPFVFIFGELLPKSLYFRAPMHFLRKGSLRFLVFHRLLLPASYPLMQLSRLFAKLGPTREGRSELVLGRNRLSQVITEGHREGILLNVQNQLVHGLIHTAAQPLARAFIPVNRLIGVTPAMSREEMLAVAQRYGTAILTVHPEGQPQAAHGYVRVSELATSARLAASLVRPLPAIPLAGTKLDALLKLRQAAAPVGAVMDGGRLMGIVNEHGLVAQLFHTPQAMRGS